MKSRKDAGRRREPPRSFSTGAMRRPSVLGVVVRSAGDFWRESFFLMVFNFLYAASTIPGLLLLLYALLSRQVVLILLGGAALAFWPYTTFGIFHAAGRAVERGPVHFRTFLTGGRRRLGLAYRWGALNFVVLGVLAVNAFFYLDPQAPLFGTWLGSFLGAIFLLACLLWAAGQACLLGFLAMSGADSLREAWKELRPQLLSRPGLVFAVGVGSLALFLAGIIVLPVGLLLGFALAAVLPCRMAADLAGGPSAIGRSPETEGSSS